MLGNFHDGTQMYKQGHCAKINTNTATIKNIHKNSTWILWKCLFFDLHYLVYNNKVIR